MRESQYNSAMPTQDEAKRALQQLIADYNRMSDAERLGMTEASVVHQFINRLLEEVLGWPIKDPARFKYELFTQAGRPDITLIPENAGTIFLEAKRFGVIKELAAVRQASDLSRTLRPDQMALPGMATDRTPEEQQAINYAFTNNGTWAILTNFERLRVFNARRDWLVISFEQPEAYLDDFGYLWQLAYENVCNGSLDGLSNQRWTKEVDTDYLAFINREREKLAQDVVVHREANGWAFDDDGAIRLPLLRSVVQRYLDRLVIVRFAEDHFVIPPGTLRQFHELRKTNPYTQTMDEYLDHFFRRFDEDHNSALFSPGPVDEASFSDAVLLPLIDELYRARYRSMPADIIGNTYEQYLGKALALDNGSVTTRDNLETRKKQGSYYTPQVIVRYIVDHSLGRVLYGTANGQPGGDPIDGETRKTAADIRALRVLDSACGSGGFLIYAYEVLANFYQSEIERLETEGEAQRQALVAEGMTSPLDLQVALTPFTAEIERIRHYPRIILEQHLYGVDLDPQAAEIAVVNLMMRAMERRSGEKRLPLILNQNVKVGNSLIGLRPDDARLDDQRDQLAQLRALRADLVRTPNNDPAHDGIVQQLTGATRTLYDDLAPDFAPHFSDLGRVKPFHWGIEFPEAFYDDQGELLDNPGFTVIFGNPPWEIVKPDLREFFAQFDERIERKLNRQQVDKRVEALKAEDPRREQDWQATTQLIEESATYYRQSSDYTQQGRGHMATHKLFLERAWKLICNNGLMGYVVPSAFYTDQGARDLREMLLREGQIKSLVSFTNGVAGGEVYFSDIHRSYKITLISAQKGSQEDKIRAIFRTDPRIVPTPDNMLNFLAEPGNYIELNRELIFRFSPDSLSFMEFIDQFQVHLASKIYDSHPLLGETRDDVWNVRFSREFDMTDDRALFNTEREGLPLYEGKMIWHYDSFFAHPQYWIDENDGKNSLPTIDTRNSDYINSRLAIRRVASNTNERTLVTAILPGQVFSGNSLFNEVGSCLATDVRFYLMSVMNSFVLDYVLRQKMTANVNLFYILQLPIPRLTAGNPYFDALVPRAARLVCVREAFADLWQEVMGTGWTLPDPHPGPPPNSGEGERPVVEAGARQRVRDEIDAIVAHLYGLERDEFGHILRTFPLVFPANAAGEAKLAALLAEYDRWAGAL